MEDFTFLFITDCHLQPELNAAGGCHQAFVKARKISSDFVIQGGDHVFDALGVSRDRATSLIDLYTKTEQDLGMKVHHTIGNHDLFGVYPASGAEPTDPLYGKKYFEDHFGKLYYSFGPQGRSFHRSGFDRHHPRPWIRRSNRRGPACLARRRSEVHPCPLPPVIVSVHIPLVTAFDSYAAPLPTPPAHHGLSVANAYEVLPLFEGHNVLGVLQGHTPYQRDSYVACEFPI